MTVSIIVAAAENGVIGRGGELPWRIPSDLKTFRRLTLGKPVIMGRKTFASLGKPLPGRDNIVVTRDPAFAADGVQVAASLDAALALAGRLAAERGAGEVMVIGGGQIYAEALARADRIYLSRVHATPAGDAHFPLLCEGDWQVVERQPLAPDPRDEHAVTLIVYERRRPGSAAAPS